MHIFNYTSFEQFIKKDISVIENIIELNFELKNSDINNSNIKFYTAHNFEDHDFYTFPSRYISVTTEDDYKTVKSITILFQGVINRSFYDAFTAQYGKPDHILIAENRQLTEEGTIKNDTGKWEAKKYTIDLREGTFEENPLYIVWKKEDYQIKAYLRPEQNMSEITFSLLSDKL